MNEKTNTEIRSGVRLIYLLVIVLHHRDLNPRPHLWLRFL